MKIFDTFFQLDDVLPQLLSGIKDFFCLQADVLSVLSHKNIIQFFGAVTKQPNYCLVTGIYIFISNCLATLSGSGARVESMYVTPEISGVDLSSRPAYWREIELVLSCGVINN